MTTADYQIRNVTTSSAWSLMADGDFVCAAGDVLSVRLQASPALDVSTTSFVNTDRSSGRAALALATGGLAVTPTSELQVTVPAATWGAWQLSCLTNGGGPVLGADGKTLDYSIQDRARIVRVLSPNLHLSHPLGEEIAGQIAAHFAISIQALIDAIDGASSGGVPATAHVLEDAATALATNGVPIRALAAMLAMAGLDVPALSTLRGSPQASGSVQVGRWGRTVSDASGHGITGTGGYMSAMLPTGTGTSVEMAAIEAIIEQIVGPYADLNFYTLTNNVRTLGLTVRGAGIRTTNVDAVGGQPLGLGGAASIVSLGSPLAGRRYTVDTATTYAGTLTALVSHAYKLDLSGALAVTLPQATDLNAGEAILLEQAVAGPGALTMTPSAGLIEGVASLTVAGAPTIDTTHPGLSVLLVSMGAVLGWKAHVSPPIPQIFMCGSRTAGLTIGHAQVAALSGAADKLKLNTSQLPSGSYGMTMRGVIDPGFVGAGLTKLIFSIGTLTSTEALLTGQDFGPPGGIDLLLADPLMAPPGNGLTVFQRDTAIPLGGVDIYAFFTGISANLSVVSAGSMTLYITAQAPAATF